MILHLANFSGRDLDLITSKYLPDFIQDVQQIPETNPSCRKVELAYYQEDKHLHIIFELN